MEILVAPSVVSGVSLSDQGFFWKESYPGVMITDSAIYRNHNYYQPADTKDTLDYPAMAELLKGIVHTARGLSGIDKKSEFSKP